MDNKTYDTLKFIAQIAIPALATLILTLGDVWGFCYVKEIAATLTAFGVFIGALLQYSRKEFWKDKEIVEKR